MVSFLQNLRLAKTFQSASCPKQFNHEVISTPRVQNSSLNKAPNIASFSPVRTACIVQTAEVLRVRVRDGQLLARISIVPLKMSKKSMYPLLKYGWFYRDLWP